MKPAFLVNVAVDADAREVVADALWQLGAAAIEEHRDGLRAGFDGREAAHAALRGIAPWATGRIECVDDTTYLDAWRPHARPVRVGRLVVHPAWLTPPPGDDAVRVSIDPGRAFGIGDHPTTRMLLAWLVDNDVAGRSVLDVGTGSGILAVSAARLGARPVHAVDVDDHSVEVARANAAGNRADAVDVELRAANTLRGRWDVVLVNLGGTQAVVALADTLARITERGGVVVIGGLLRGRDGPAREALEPAFAVHRVAAEGVWVTLRGERR